MPTCSAEVRKTSGTGQVSVAVEVTPNPKFHMKFDPLSLSKVCTTEGVEIDPGPMCLSGARYARHVFPLEKSRIIVRSAKGIIEPLDHDALCMATILAIGRALNLEQLIPEEVFHGHGGSWEKYSGD